MPSSEIVVGVFQHERQAREAVDAVRSLGLTDASYGLLAPGQSLSTSDPRSAGIGRMLAGAAASSERSNVENVLETMGVPAGEARFYAEEAADGQTLLVVNADGRSRDVRELVLDHGGFDVLSRGAAFIRGQGSGVPGGVRPRPIDLTDNWFDVRSRYEMLWQQHYGTTDATWEQMEPLYEYAWQVANDPRYRGRPWSEVQGSVRRDWEASALSGGALAWQDAAGPMRDVWEDVAQEALTGAEGGADRRIPTSGTDQSIAARDLQPPRQGAA